MTAPGPRVQSRKVGDLTVHAIQAGGQKLDGGAMFGVVPKPLWEKRIPADDRNRIQLGMRCLLIEHPSGLILIDTGAGNKENAKFKDIYGLENEGASGGTMLEDGLKEVGVTPTDIALVINTHLHFDHAGGNTRIRGEDGPLEISFPNATYIVKRGEEEVKLTGIEYKLLAYLAANHGRILTHQSILSHVWGPADADHTEYLRVYMRQLRKKLEEDPQRPQYIHTEPGIGYRFIADE